MPERSLADRRLRHLYEISTLLTRFAGIDETLAGVVDVAARDLPVRTAALVLDTDAGLLSHVWKAPDVDEAATDAALARARASYAWFAAGSSRVARVSSPPSIRALAAPPRAVGREPAEGAQRFVVLPLVVERARVFGVLQVESVASLDEADIVFVDAVVNQVAIALHRQLAIDAAEARVRSQLDFTRAITASLGEGVVATDARGCISFLNPVAEQLLGCSEREVLGAPAAEVVQVRRADGGDHEECPLVRALATASRVASDDHAFVTHDGRVVPVSYIAAPIRNASGVSGAVLACRDVVAAKRSERIQRLHGDCSAALGRSLALPSILDALVRCLVPTFADACTVEATGTDATSATETVITVPIATSGRSFGVLTSRMVTPGRTFAREDREVAEEIGRRAAIALENAHLHAQTEKAVRDREEILAVVSHDLRSPLNTIVLAVMAIRETARAVDANITRKVDIIGRAADRMSRMTRDLLDASSIEGNRLAIDPKPTRIAAIATDLVEALDETARARSVTLTVQQSDVALLAHCDHDRILQVLTNLVGNAIKFTPAGGFIDVRLEGDGDDVRFTVTDTGSGISPDLVPHVFERNRQATETASQGRGLGLFIAKGIVEAHRGRIQVESEPGAGTTFQVRLPRVRGRDVAKTDGMVTWGQRRPAIAQGPSPSPAGGGFRRG